MIAGPSVTILEPETEEDFERYYELRWRILRAPWHQPRGSERDALDAQAIHLMACLADRVPVGVGRLHLVAPGEARIRYMAVAPAQRGLGIGRRLLAALEGRARTAGVRRIRLEAREAAVEFYRRHGYRAAGPGHVLYGRIRHRRMDKTL
ncbi:MAG: GNAT family N-acetyltransferase [Gammaproteobacteria bacterium]|nr:GNAT family N-acetyltransferase [Gammaproteobacteria bacterium]